MAKVRVNNRFGSLHVMVKVQSKRMGLLKSNRGGNVVESNLPDFLN